MEANCEEDIVLPGDKDGALVDCGADLEADTIVRKENEVGDAAYPEQA